MPESLRPTIHEPQERHTPICPRGSSLSTVVFFSALFVGTGLAPYLLFRRKFTRLERQLEALRTANAALAREMRAASTDVGRDRAVLAGSVRAYMHELEQSREVFSAKLDRLTKGQDDLAKGSASVRAVVEAAAAAQREREGETKRLANLIAAKSEEERQRYADGNERHRETTELIRGLKEELHRRYVLILRNGPVCLQKYRSAIGTISPVEVRELARALADMAAFVEEVEIREGWTPRRDDGRGVERMRNLGKRLDSLAVSTVSDCLQTMPIGGVRP